MSDDEIEEARRTARRIHRMLIPPAYQKLLLKMAAMRAWLSPESSFPNTSLDSLQGEVEAAETNKVVRSLILRHATMHELLSLHLAFRRLIHALRPEASIDNDDLEALTNDVRNDSSLKNVVLVAIGWIQR